MEAVNGERAPPKKHNNANKQSRSEDTPVGDKDNAFKIHICVEFLNTSNSTLDMKKQSRHEGKPTGKTVLKVTISGLKNLPKMDNGKFIDPYVKLRLAPDNILWTTELKNGNDATYFFDSFEHWVDTLEGKTLAITVCDKRVTRHAKVYGILTLTLSDIKLGKPLEKWYNL